VNGHAGDVIGHPFALAGVNAGANLHSECAGTAADPLGAANRLCGTVKRAQRAIADHRAEPSAGGFDPLTEHILVLNQNRTPASIPDLRKHFGRADDIREQERHDRAIRLHLSR
jgi:hypothetical protein